MVCWQQAIATECQLLLDTLSHHVLAITVAITPYGSHVLSFSALTNAQCPLSSSTLHPSLNVYPVAVDNSLNGSDCSSHITHVKNMANFQGTNPKTRVVCALFRFSGDDILSFSVESLENASVPSASKKTKDCTTALQIKDSLGNT